jgi:hypothetical protein
MSNANTGITWTSNYPWSSVEPTGNETKAKEAKAKEEAKAVAQVKAEMDNPDSNDVDFVEDIPLRALGAVEAFLNDQAKKFMYDYHTASLVKKIEQVDVQSDEHNLILTELGLLAMNYYRSK